MAATTILLPSAPAPAGALAAYVALYAPDNVTPPTPTTWDIDDLEVTVTLEPGSLAGSYRLGSGRANVPDDGVLAVYPPAGIAAGDYIVTTVITSAELGLAGATANAGVVIGGHRYGATFAGVEALVADLTLTYASNPSAADVDRWLDELGERVAGRIGPLDALADDVEALYVARAAGLVHLGAAAYTSDAAHPDRVQSQQDQRYGGILWARFLEGLDELAADVARDRGAEGLDPLAGLDRAAASFPPPLFHRGLEL